MDMKDPEPVFKQMLELYLLYKRKAALDCVEWVQMPLGTIRTVAYSYNCSGKLLMDDVPLMNDVFNLCANQTGLHFTIVDFSYSDFLSAGCRFYYKVVCTKNILIEGNKDLLDVLSI
jgi:hypothetical protein